jgi:hypothetical protein
MRDLSDADVLTFALAGCNAAEVAAYGGIPEKVALARINRALRNYGQRDRLPVLTLPRAAA